MASEERAQPVDTQVGEGAKHQSAVSGKMRVEDRVKHVFVKEKIAQLFDKKCLAIDDTLTARRHFECALGYLNSALINDDARSYYFAGECLALARNHLRDFSDCYLIWKIGSDYGDSLCDYALGCALYFGVGIERDFHGAMDAFRRAANAGLIAAIPFLYFSYLNGDRGRVDLEFANKWKQKYPQKWPMQRLFSPWKRWWIVCEGRVMSVSEFAHSHGISSCVLHYRLTNGASLGSLSDKRTRIVPAGIEVNGEFLSAGQIGEIAGISSAAVYRRKKWGKDPDLLKKKAPLKLYEYKGEMIPMSKLSSILHMDSRQIRYFLAKGCSVEEIITGRCYKVNESCWGWKVEAWGGVVKPLSVWLEERRISRDEFIREMRGRFEKCNLRSALYRVVRKRSLKLPKGGCGESL